MGTGNFPEYVREREDEQDWVALVSTAVKDAVAFSEELAPERVKATDYYHGRPLGNEVSGRSTAQMTEVRDGILGVLPSLLRVIHGPEHVVEYVPKRGEAVQGAQQATDYIRYVYEEDNHGFLISHALLKDGLLKKLGIVKWGIDNTPVTKTTKYQNVTVEDLMMLAERGELDVVSEQDGLYEVEVKETVPSGRIWVKNVPPDDFFWNREARSLDEAILVGHRERLTKSQLLQMGVSERDIEDFGGSEPQETLEEAARRQEIAGDDPDMGEENRRFLYAEVYMMLDGELRRICTLGEQYIGIKNEPCEERPFAIFSPDPEPHAMLGGSWYDLLKDTQRINSQLLRGFLDSLSVSLFPRPVYVDGQASVADILNTAIGAPVRERQPGMVRWDNVPFAGDKVLPALEMMRGLIERRIGQKDGAGSLDMDALQSTGKEAVNAAITAAQSQAEMLTRLFAEMTLKPLFKGLLKLATLPESKARIVRLRGTYVEVNPATWDAEMDVSVNVALGTMNTEKKVAVLMQVAQDQQAILEQYGMENPAVTLQMLFNTKSQILRLNGIKDTDTYYTPIPNGWTPPPPPEPEPTPDELWIQAEKEMAFQKAMKELAIKQDELALEREKAATEAALKDRELAIREQEVQLKNTIGPHNPEIERYKADKDAEIRAADIAMRAEIEREKLALEREKMYLDAQVKQYATDKQGENSRYQTDTKAKASSEKAKMPALNISQPELGKLAQAIEGLKNVKPPVVNVEAPVVHVPAPVVNFPAPEKRKGRKAKLTGPDGKVFTIETQGDE